MNWDDLRIARAVYQARSFAAAAARLQINETTVARRLARLQDDLGITLFEAVDGARRPTPQCEELVTLAEAMAGQAERIAGLGHAEAGLVGRRRIATTDSIAAEVLAPRVPAFLADNPGLVLDLLASTENVNFSRWEADIAVRLNKPDKGNFVVSKLADLDFYLFEPVSADPPLVCAYPEDLASTPESLFLSKSGLRQYARCTTKNLLVVKRLVASQQCSGVLPSFMSGELLANTNLRARTLPQTRGVWLLMQSHLKRDAATRKVIDWIRSCFEAALAGPDRSNGSAPSPVRPIVR